MVASKTPSIDRGCVRMFSYLPQCGLPYMPCPSTDRLCALLQLVIPLPAERHAHIHRGKLPCVK